MRQLLASDLILLDPCILGQLEKFQEGKTFYIDTDFNVWGHSCLILTKTSDRKLEGTH